MNDWQQTIADAVLRIATRLSSATEVQPQQALARDLRFSSLDFAELVATLETKLEVDPFAKDVLITKIHTVQDLYDAYGRYFT